MSVPRYISYNWLGALADHCMDKSADYYRRAGTTRLHNKNLRPEAVRPGDVVFVKTDYIYSGIFQKEVLPYITNPFILVSGTSDRPAAGGAPVGPILESPLVLKWCCTNVSNLHNSKIYPVPLGFQEKDRGGGDQTLIKNLISSRTPFSRKKSKILLPPHMETDSRTPWLERLQALPYVHWVGDRVSWKEYMKLLDQYKFVVCLEGNGVDTHRNWEVLAMQSVPISPSPTMAFLFNFHRLPYFFLEPHKELAVSQLSKLAEQSYAFQNADRVLTTSYHSSLIKNPTGAQATHES